MNQIPSETSSAFELLSLSSLKDLKNEGPINLRLTYEDGFLSFLWRYNSLHKLKSGYFCRSFLLIPVESSEDEHLARKLAAIFYNRLELGHLLKVFFPTKGQLSHWIQKTSAGLQLKMHNSANVGDLKSSLNQAMRQAKKNSQITEIILFPKSKFSNYRQLDRMVMRMNPTFTVYAFAEGNKKDEFGDLKQIKIMNYKEDNLLQIIKNMFEMKSRLRIIRTQTRLFPKNSLKQLYFQNRYLNWKSGDYLFKDNYHMMEDEDYIQTLNISGGSPVLTFQLQFLIELIDNSKYSMSLDFTVDKNSEDESFIPSLSYNRIVEVCSEKWLRKDNKVSDTNTLRQRH